MIHPSADVSEAAQLGEGTRVWHQAQVREGAVIGRGCILGKGSYVDVGVRIGDNCKLQNGVFVYHGFDLEDGVFLGPSVMLLNDKNPRAINPDGSLKSDSDWHVSRAVVRHGASVGGGAVVLPGINIGTYALVGAGAVVTRDVPDHGIVVGNPARLRAFACVCGHRLAVATHQPSHVLMRCQACGREVTVDPRTYRLLEDSR
jgi:UDP-2-acetamido-3-amino-2,3-dideoxy-glucuronate N-acetyltransferase